MNHYDAYGRRIPRSRSDAVRPRRLDVLVVLLSFAAILALVGWMLRAKEYSETIRRAEELGDSYGLTAMECMSAIKTQQGEVIRLYVMKDPDRGTEYVVCDKGGLYPREPKDEG